ncbi:MAG: pectinesterase family protein, partial [bacterium]|nr:pectinesterase family protein [bacterium]
MRNVVKRGISLALVLSIVVSTTFSNVQVSASQVAKTETKKIDVWDFGGVTEGNAALYNNNITASSWNSIESVAADGKFVEVDNSTTLKMGDLSLFYTETDRLYVNSLDSDKSVDRSWGQSKVDFKDGYKSAGCYYANGTGSSKTRYITIKDVKAGDLITTYMGSSNSNDSTLVFEYQGKDGQQSEERSFDSTKLKYEFIAKYDGSYKLYTPAGAGAKPVYYRIMKTPSVSVTGTVDFGSLTEKTHTVSFINDKTEEVTKAVSNGNSFTASLTPGYSYTAVLSGIPGVGVTSKTKVVAPTIDEIQSGKVITLQLEQKALVELTGTVEGFAEDTDTSNLSVTLEPVDSNLDAVDVKVNSDCSFKAEVQPGVMYNIVIEGVNDYDLVGEKQVQISEAASQNITVAKKTTYEAKGTFLELPQDLQVSKLEFIHLEDDYRYVGTVEGNSFKTMLRNGSYRVEATVKGYTTNTHIVVNGQNVTKDLLFVTTSSKLPAMTRVSDIYVGYGDKEHNYATVNEALTACKAMNPKTEEDRITVHIAPGLYREQIIVETPYISFVNDDPSKEVTLTWYYGIGYKYYSVNEKGYYSKENAHDLYEKAAPVKWGTTTYIKNKATGFTAENIIFEASFNRYVTEEEIADGVELTGAESIKFNRELGADVASKEATERAAAMCIEGDKAKFVNCSFLSSQDTLFTGNANTKSYFKDCFIEGNTDYIFGDGDVVFDTCTLSWYGYTKGSTAGYITAARNTLSENGYLFKDCTVTGNQAKGFTVTPGYLGRPWGATAKVAFIDTVLSNASMIDPVGWTYMSGVKPEEARFVEYNTTYADHSKVDTSKRVAGTVITDASDYTIEKYLGDFVVTPEIPVTGTPTIWVVGDSTVSSFTDSYYYPRYGWGTQLDQFFDTSKVEIKNIALSGRSSKSYTSEKQYKELLEGMKAGDYLFIGFGHNDEKAEAARYTDPNGDYKTEGSFANSLYESYIKPAKAAGCTPILMTPIVRRSATGTFSKSDQHITSTTTDSKGNVYPGGDYPLAIHTLGSQLSIPVVDLTKMTKEHFETIGAAESVNYHAWTSYKETSVDNTHTNILGATYNGYLIAKEIKSLNVKGLADHVIADSIVAAPTKEAVLKPNPNYIVPEYDSNLKDSENWQDHGIWKGTVFGDVESGYTVNDFKVQTDASGDVNIAASKGKVSASTDGIAMYYYKIPVGSTFTLSATAKVNSLDSESNEVAFGLMARDDMYIDTTYTSPLGDYVAAGPVKIKSEAWNCFARKSGVLTSGGKATNQVKTGDTIDLKIESNSDGYACTMGEEKTVTGGFDFPLTSVDSDYVYIGMFAAKNADITYTNIKLIVDGKQVFPITEVPSVPIITPTPVVRPTPVETIAPEVSSVPIITPTPVVRPTPVETVTPEV